jgi:hypothetical protein
MPYNFILFVIGTASILLVYEFSQVSGVDSDSCIESGLPMILFAVGANAGYTLGWIIELAASDTIDKRTFGPRMFLRGTIFSMVLCGLPALAVIISGIWTAISR